MSRNIALDRSFHVRRTGYSMQMDSGSIFLMMNHENPRIKLDTGI